MSDSEKFLKEWFGSTPSHWKTVTLGRCIDRIEQGWSPVAAAGHLDETQWAVLSLSAVTRGNFNASAIKPIARNLPVPSHLRIESGDLLVTRANTRSRVGDACIVRNPRDRVIFSDLMYRISPRTSTALPEWLLFQLLNPAGRFQMEIMARGSSESMPKLSQGHLKRVAITLPPLDEQRAIIKYVRHAERQIGFLVRSKQRLISLLTEHRDALIRKHVTNDRELSPIDSNARASSPIKSPAEWKVIPLKRISRKIVDCEHKTAPAVTDSEFRVVRTSGVRHGQLVPAGTYCTDARSFSEWTRRLEPRPGDVIFTREAPVGEACVIPEGIKVCLGQRTVLIRPNTDAVLPEWIVNQIYHGPPVEIIGLASQGTTVGHFNMDDIGSMPLSVPAVEEQVRLLEQIQHECSPIDIALSRVEREISLLREYQTRLTSDAVTGRLDVRAASAALPDVSPNDLSPAAAVNESGLDADLDGDHPIEESK
ncbi:restriction endonuclease subunit S [Streptomyces sp. NPDC088400]|uniref:restriction endonuclease subunit S n=1 Tax=Streptomyces sp. NPDC088400 TaxID=3365861 RepID=UPI0038015C6D